jgi:flagellar hook-associated protein FlgK
MGLIGDILKGSQALRYHAKSAEIAGKNLANVNNADYARQRLLAKEAYMYTDGYSLATGGLRADGLDHMRNDLLDRRVINELSGGGSLEARQEILGLLQLVLGEKIDRQSLNAGLDDIHESDLAPGSLTRALNDFFNAFQELSAAPTEASVRQEVIHKANTLVARINDMGNGLDRIDKDITVTVANQVKSANGLLSKMHVINRDIRRFELQGKGRATDLRDLRQKALENLSKILDFTVTDDVDAVTGEGTGLISISVKDKEGNTLVLLDETGAKELSTDAKLNFIMDTPTSEGATAAQIRAVIDTQGKLADVEIIDGGSGYDDSKIPINFTFTIPTSSTIAAIQNAAEATTFSERIAAFTASGLIEKVTTGATKYVRTTDGLTDSATDVVINGFESDLTLRPYKAGDVIVDGENHYQALVDTLPWDTTQTDETAQTGAKLSDATKFLKLSAIPDAVGVVSYDTAKTRGAGYKVGDLVENGGKHYQAIGVVAPVVAETGVDGETTGVTTQAYQAGDVIQYNGTYYQATLDLAKGATLEGLGTTAGDDDTAAGGTGFLTLGADLPILGQEQIFSRTQNQTFAKGDYVFDGEKNRYYLAVSDFTTNGEPALPYPLETSSDLVEVNAFKLADGTIASRNGQSFDADKFTELNLSYVYPDGSTVAGDIANIATAEAVIKNGEIIGFNITNAGSGYPLTDSIFLNDTILDIKSGSLHGYQQARQVEMENFRVKLNTLIGDIVTKVNKAYNPDDDPGKYLFGFPSMLSRVTQGPNQLYPDQQGDGTFKLYGDEVDLTLPYAESDTFTIVNASAFFPEDRNTDRELMVEDPSFSKTYVGARRMQYVTIENDMKWVGDDGVSNTQDDGRSLILGYEEMPFRMVQGENTFIFGDNFSFDALIKGHRNLAKALQLDDGFTFDNLVSTHTGEDGANEIALAIAEMGNGDFTEQVSVINTDVGTSLGDVVDNLEHQQMVEGMLVDERQSISAVSLDEEVSNLMRYQRAFQASARVVTTLDNMLELVVMGLIR